MNRPDDRLGGRSLGTGVSRASGLRFGLNGKVDGLTRTGKRTYGPMAGRARMDREHMCGGVRRLSAVYIRAQSSCSG